MLYTFVEKGLFEARYVFVASGSSHQSFTMSLKK